MPLDVERLRWHGVPASFRAEPLVCSRAERTAALRRYLGSAGLSGHERLAIAAAARAVGIDVAASSDAAKASIQIIEPPNEARRRGSFGIVAEFALAMLGSSLATAGQATWLTLDEVAALLKLDHSEVEQLLQDGHLGHVAIPQRNGNAAIRVLPRHLEEMARTFERGKACPNEPSRGFQPPPNWPDDRDATIGIYSGTTRRKSAVDDGPPAQQAAPRLKLPGRGSAPTGATRPNTKARAKGPIDDVSVGAVLDDYWEHHARMIASSEQAAIAIRHLKRLMDGALVADLDDPEVQRDYVDARHLDAIKSGTIARELSVLTRAN